MRGEWMHLDTLSVRLVLDLEEVLSPLQLCMHPLKIRPFHLAKLEKNHVQNVQFIQRRPRMQSQATYMAYMIQ
jgi:hypothetical protein